MFKIFVTVSKWWQYFLMEHKRKVTKTVTQECHIKINQTLDINKQCVWIVAESCRIEHQRLAQISHICTLWEKKPASFSHLIIIHDSFPTYLLCVAITSNLFFFLLFHISIWIVRVCNSDVINCCCLSRRVGALHLHGLTPVDEFYMKTSSG